MEIALSHHFVISGNHTVIEDEQHQLFILNDGVVSIHTTFSVIALGASPEHLSFVDFTKAFDVIDDKCVI